MFQSKLVRLLNAFSEEETRQIGQFLKSPFVNDGKRPAQVQALMEYLAKHHPAFDDPAVSREQIFKAIFPEAPAFNAGKLDKVSSELTGILRKFVAFNSVSEEMPHEFWLAQARFSRQRGLDGEFRQALDQLEKLHGEAAAQGQEFYFRKFSLEAERVRQLAMVHDWRGDLNLPNTIQALDLYYIVSKLEHSSHLLSLSASTLIDSPQSFLFLDETLDLAKKHYPHVPIVAAYYHAFSLLLHRQNPDLGREDEAYWQLKEVLRQHSHRFLPDTMKALHAHLRNYTSARYNRGENDCLAELLALFKEHDRLGALVQGDGRILAGTLNSAVNVALKLGDHDWASGFLQRHADRLANSDDSPSIYQFNLANCHFHRGDFEAAEQCLTNLQLREMIYKLAARRLEIKLLYETDSPLLDARLDAFKVFVHEAKQTLTADRLEPNNHFTDIMRQLRSPKTLGNPARIDKLLKTVSTKKAVAEREWLAQKLERLLPGRRK